MPAIDDARTKKRAVTRRGRTRFPGIIEHAKCLKVNPSHLYRVLVGKRTSASLQQRYDELIAEETRR